MDPLHNKLILVPTDFSEVCENAMNQAAETASHIGFRVTLLHVIDSNTKSMLKKDGQDESYIEEKLKSIAEKLADENLTCQHECPSRGLKQDRAVFLILLLS